MTSNVEEVSEAAQRPYIPFIGRVNLSLATGVALFVGAMVWSMMQNSADTAAQALGAWIGNTLGFNPATGSTNASNGPAYGGD